MTTHNAISLGAFVAAFLKLTSGLTLNPDTTCSRLNSNRDRCQRQRRDHSRDRIAFILFFVVSAEHVVPINDQAIFCPSTQFKPFFAQRSTAASRNGGGQRLRTRSCQENLGGEGRSTRKCQQQQALNHHEKKGEHPQAQAPCPQ